VSDPAVFVLVDTRHAVDSARRYAVLRPCAECGGEGVVAGEGPRGDTRCGECDGHPLIETAVGLGDLTDAELRALPGGERRLAKCEGEAPAEDDTTRVSA
jgi:hypothetical protein